MTPLPWQKEDDDGHSWHVLIKRGTFSDRYALTFMVAYGLEYKMEMQF